ncbi:MAG: hypothetical protein MUC63_11105, partial [Planctomycetes bacterium]|nr:hypothetical protein [Planctomycetota bacterium]
MSIENFNIEDTRNKLLEVYNNVNALNAKLMEDHKAENVCVGFSEYKKELPGKFLERASGHLAKKGYFVGVAGVFSAGKSTMINALLREPGMLPTAIHSCTYSLTRIGGAGAGDEHLEIK